MTGKPIMRLSFSLPAISLGNSFGLEKQSSHIVGSPFHWMVVAVWEGSCWPRL